MSDGTAPDLEAAPSFFSSLRYPGSKRYFLGLTLSMVGTWMQSIALAWLVVKVLNGGGRELGLVSVFQFGPILLLGMYAGALSDRFDKRKLMFVTQLLMGSAALLLAYFDFTGRESLSAIYVLSAVSGLASAFDTPVRRAMIGDLVPKAALPNAMSLNTGVMTSTRVLGMAAGGFVVRYAGTEWCFLANGVSYLAMMAALVGLSNRKHATVAAPKQGGVVVALREVWKVPDLRLVMVTSAVAATLTFNYQTTFPLMVKNVFRYDADSLGTLFAMTSVGTLAGALASARRRRPSVGWFLLGVALMGIGAGLFAVVGSFAWGLAAVVPLGAGGGLFMSQMSGLLTSMTDASMRGRVLALQSVVFLGSTPIGGPIVGAIADARGARWASAAGGIAAVVAAGAGWFVQRNGGALRSARRGSEVLDL